MSISSQTKIKIDPLKQKFNRSVVQKLPSGLNKFHCLAIFIVILALPVTVYLAQSQTNIASHADNSTVLADSLNLEDNPPADPVVVNDPVALAQAEAAVNSIPSTVTTTSKPNIVVIMADDINPIDGRLWRSTRTPNIYNNIIAKGVQFTNYYDETSLCCPGRVSFLTGQHTQNHGVADLDGTQFKPSETIATELNNSGYYTMLTGKYVNNYANFTRSNIIPPGWSKFDAIFNNNGKYFNYYWVSKTGPTSYSKAYHGQKAGDYSTDVIANTAVLRLKQAPADKPIFAFITPFASHKPTTPAPRYVGDPRCKGIDTWDTMAFNQSDSNKPQYVRNLPVLTGRGYDLVKICETQLAVDDLVAKVVKELKAEGRYNNTILVFTADNGMAWGAHKLTAKTVPYSTQLPLYVSWPAVMGSLARVDATTLSNIDFAPTLCSVGGCQMGSHPYPNGQTRADGISFLNLLKNQPMAIDRDVIMENQPVAPLDAAPSTRPAWWGIRTTASNPLGLWHYIEYADGENELYDISHGPCDKNWTVANGGDPCELHNLLGPHVVISAGTSSLAQQLHDRLTQLKAEKGYTPPPTVTPTSAVTPTPTIVPISTSTLILNFTPTPTVGPTTAQTPASVKTGTLKFNAGTYSTYTVSGTIASGRQNFTVTNNKTWQTTAPAITATYIGTKLTLVKLTGANGQTSLVGRYISTSTGTWTTP